jgi:hypothetical protein
MTSSSVIDRNNFLLILATSLFFIASRNFS